MVNDVVAIVVTYNRINLLKECINALANGKKKCDIIIINNNSNDGTKEYLNDLKLKDINIIVFNLIENIGGAGGYNFGIKKAMEYKYEYFYLLDDDTVVDYDSLYVLYDTAKNMNNKFAFLSSKVLWKDGNICKTNVQRNAVARKVKDFVSEIVKIDYASFVSFFIKREDVLRLGLPIKEFFIWSDDLEYSRRFTIKNKNNLNKYDGYLCNKSIVIHKCIANYGVDITKEVENRIDRYKYIYRNDVYVFKKEGFRGYVFLLVRLIYHIFKVLFYSNNKSHKIKIILNGYIDGLKFNPKIEYI